MDAKIPDKIVGTTASGSTAQGGKDNFTFAGRITALTLEGGPARVYINGEPVDPAEYRPNTSASTSTPTPTSEAVLGPKPPLDPETLAREHARGLREAGNFTVNYTSSLRNPAANGPETNRRGARVNLGANTVYLVSHPTEETTRYTYAEGTMAYKKTVFAGLDEPSYEVDQLGQPLAESLINSGKIATTVRAVEYERAGTITRDGHQLAVYVANGTDSVTTDVLYRNEDLSAFSSTLVLNPETGVVHLLQTERTTDHLSSGEPVTIVETLQFSAIGSTNVDQPAWVARLEDQEGENELNRVA